MLVNKSELTANHKMKSLRVISVVLLLAVSISVSAEPSCGANEVLDECPTDCPYDRCPEDEYQDLITCRKPNTCPPPACKCIFNHRRAKDGTCIPTTKCPPFNCTRVNEEYNPCPSYCPSDNCRDASPYGLCPYWILIVVSCSPKCKCIEHHWRNNGVCVPYEKCPNIKARARNDKDNSA